MYQSGHPPEDDQQLDEIFIDIPPSNVRLHQCPVCSRKFNHESLLKHVEICEKINTKTRKPFDSTGQRLKGTEFTAVSAAAANIAGSRQAISKFDNYRASPPKTVSCFITFKFKTKEVNIKDVLYNIKRLQCLCNSICH